MDVLGISPLPTKKGVNVVLGFGSESVLSLNLQHPMSQI